MYQINRSKLLYISTNWFINNTTNQNSRLFNKETVKKTLYIFKSWIYNVILIQPLVHWYTSNTTGTES